MACNLVSRYHQTKLANCVFTYALAKKLEAKGSNVKAMVAHPGLSATSLQDTTVKDGGSGHGFMGFLMRYSQSAEDGAMGILRCACDPEAKSGDFYGPSGGKTAFSGPAVHLTPELYLHDDKSIETLWAASNAAIGEEFNL